MRAMSTGIIGRTAIPPRVEPVVIVAARAPTIALGKFGVIHLGARIRLADDDAGAGDAQFMPNTVSADLGQIPLWFAGSRFSFLLRKFQRRRRTQMRADHDLRHISSPC